MDELTLHEEYINGLVQMASACSTWIGCSEIAAACFPPDRPVAEELAKEFGARPEQMAVTPVSLTLSQVFAQWLGGKEKKLRDSLLWLLHTRLGDPGQVYRLKDEEKLLGCLGWGEGGKGRYYFVEDVIVVSFEDCPVCFYKGNNE